MMRPTDEPSSKKAILALVLAALAAAAMILGFFWIIPIEGTTLAMDWKGLWEGIKGGAILYGNQTGLRIPPWSAVLLLPLGFLPFRLSWGVISLITIAVLVVSVPKAPKNLRVLSTFILATSYPALRTIVDGNFEAFVIGGALLLVHGFDHKNVFTLSAGILLVATKVQEGWILLLVLPALLFAQLNKRQIMQVILIVGVIVSISLLWKGQEWIEAVFAIEQRGSIMDSSLWTTASRWGLPPLVRALIGVAVFGTTIAIGLRWRASNELSGFTIAASLLLAPYAAGNSYLSVLTLGVVPLFLQARAPGLALILLANAPYLVIRQRELLFWWSAPYWTLVLLLTWALLGIHLTRKSSPEAEPG